MSDIESIDRAINELTQLECDLYPDFDATVFVSNFEFIKLISKWYQSRVLDTREKYIFSEADLLDDFYAFLKIYFKKTGKKAMHPRQLLAIKIAVFYFSQIRQIPVLEPDIYQLIKPLTVLLVKVILLDIRAAFTAQGYFRSLIYILLNITKGYDQYSGNRFVGIVQELELTVRRIANLEQPSANFLRSLTDELLRKLKDFNITVEPFEKKIKEKESSLIVSRLAKKQVETQVHALMHGKKLPLFIVSFLQQTWVKYLYITLLRDGLDSDVWKQAMIDLETLIWSVTTEDSDKLQNEYGTRVCGMMRNIRLALNSMHHNITNTDIFFEEIESEQMQRIAGEILDDSRCIVVPAIAEEDPEMEYTGYPLFKRVKVGDWVWLTQDETRIKARVIEKTIEEHPESRYLLFSNYSGVRVACLSEYQFESLYEQGLISFLSFDTFFSQVPSALMVFLNELKLETKERKIEKDFLSRMARERKKLEEIKKQQEEEERQRALENIKRQKAMDLRRMQDITTKVEQLNLGAFVEFFDENGNGKKCKLGLILSSTGKLIFLNKHQQQEKTIYKVDLIHMIRDKKADIIESGQSFDDSLRNLVLHRREKLSNT